MHDWRNMNDDDDLAASVPDLAKRLKVSKSHLYDLVRTQQIPSIHLGRRILIPLPAVTQLLNPACPADSVISPGPAAPAATDETEAPKRRVIHRRPGGHGAK